MRLLYFVSLLLAFAGVLNVNVNADFIGGSDVVGRGFNAKTGEASLCPLFQLTESSRKINGLSVPDQFKYIAKSGSSENLVSSLSAKYSDFLKTYLSMYTFSIGLEFGVFGFGYGKVKILGQVKHTLDARAVVHGYSRHSITLYQLNLLPPEYLDIDEGFKSGIEFLPDFIHTAEDEEKYDQFISFCGTDYVRSAVFGGNAYVSTFTNITYFQSQSTEYTASQMGLAFHYYLFAVSAGSFKSQSDIQMDEGFLHNSESLIYFTGGDAAYQSINTLPQWVQSIQNAPVYTNATLSPIYDLLPEPKRTTFKNYRSAYLARAV